MVKYLRLRAAVTCKLVDQLKACLIFPRKASSTKQHGFYIAEKSVCTQPPATVGNHKWTAVFQKSGLGRRNSMGISENSLMTSMETYKKT